MYEDTAGDIEYYNNSILMVDEDEDADSNIDAILENIGVCESEDEIDPNHFEI